MIRSYDTLATGVNRQYNKYLHGVGRPQLPLSKSQRSAVQRTSVYKERFLRIAIHLYVARHAEIDDDEYA